METLAAAVQTAAAKAYVVLDGTLLSIDRVGMRTGANRPYYSGKHKRHGPNVQVLTDPAGRLLWGQPRSTRLDPRRQSRPPARPGPRADRLEYPVLADRGYEGAAGTIRVPFRGRVLPAGPTAVNTAHARLRAPGERGPATLKAGVYCTGCAAARNAAPTSSPPSSPSEPPPEPEVGKGSPAGRVGCWVVCDMTVTFPVISSGDAKPYASRSPVDRAGVPHSQDSPALGNHSLG